MQAEELILVSAAGLLAGIVNAIAGGGSLISFPALLATGLPSVVANVTNAVAVLPGYVGGTVAYRDELRRGTHHLRQLAPVTAGGSLVGGLVLLASPDALFEQLVPFLILLSCGLLAFQPALARVVQSGGAGQGTSAVTAGQFCVAVYGGYFGAGVGIMMLAVLGIFLSDGLQELNALKGALSLLTAAVSVALFAAFAPVAWLPAGCMALTCLIGGHVGVRLARRLSPTLLRSTVVIFGVLVALSLMR